MTEIQFFHNVRDKLTAACELVAHYYAGGRRVLVLATERSQAARLDQMLWSFNQLAFVPHCAHDSPLAAETPVLIGPHLEVPGHDDVLVSLSSEVPAGFARFRALLEIVGLDDADRIPARQRWKHYKDRGYPLTAQDYLARAGSRP